jgi:hypothetical protein
MSVDARNAALRIAAVATAWLVAGAAFAATPTVHIEHFAAATTAMKPADVTLRVDVREWSNDDARAAVAAALSGDDVQKALSALPTVGYVWSSTGAVGYSVKYAYKTPNPQGDRITLVTDKRLGSYDFKPWTADNPATSKELPYSVIELDLGAHTGSFSLAGNVNVDAQQKLVSLATDAPRLLTNARIDDDRS